MNYLDTANKALDLIQRVRNSAWTGDVGIGAIVYGILLWTAPIEPITAASIAAGCALITMSLDIFPSQTDDPTTNNT